MDKNKVQPLEGQSPLDVAVQTAGSVEAAIALAMANDISVSDDLAPAELRTPEIKNKAVKQYYDRNAIKPATAVTDKGQIFEDIFNNVFQ